MPALPATVCARGSLSLSLLSPTLLPPRRGHKSETLSPPLLAVHSEDDYDRFVGPGACDDAKGPDSEVYEISLYALPARKKEQRRAVAEETRLFGCFTRPYLRSTITVGHFILSRRAGFCGIPGPTTALPVVDITCGAEAGSGAPPVGRGWRRAVKTGMGRRRAY